MRRVGLALLVILAGACRGPCRALAELQCECSPNTIERNSCIQRVANSESTAGITALDATTCEALLAANQCDCRLVDTAAGRERCGMARPRPNAGMP